MKTSTKSEMDRLPGAALRENKSGRPSRAIALLLPLAAKSAESAAVAGEFEREFDAIAS
jgi:hypothetical protein